MNLSTLLGFFLLLVAISCRERSTEIGVTPQGVHELQTLHEQFRLQWLNNDSAAVVNLFSDDAEIIPPNYNGNRVVGKEAIGRYWFPPSETTYVITRFTYANDSLFTDGRLAFWRGQSEVEWNTVSRGAVLSSSLSRSDFIIVCKKVENRWMMFRQMWNVKPKN